MKASAADETKSCRRQQSSAADVSESEIESLKVCALSAVGTRAVLELHELGYQLVF